MRGITAAGAVACLLATGAYARGPRRNVEAIKTMDSFGRCVGKHRVDAIRFLSTIPDSAEEHRQAERISTSSCLSGGELKFKPNLLRGAVAEIMLKSDKAWLHRVGVVYTFVVPSDDAMSNASDVQRAEVKLVLFGECVAHENPSAAMALFGTPVESRAESLAFVPLRDAMTRCSTVDFKVDRFQMRGFLAEGAYRDAVTVVPS